ncbi:hypothetical protein [Lewinella sp. IMCC34191]|uniref:hypothetical protein n=1 Tax=Lewinella sp. IMCC34191 TaxID=2259172 RepID=UPI000E24A8DC|nr:hypothetical protein [Lewinella sp. IMCC34191]
MAGHLSAVRSRRTNPVKKAYRDFVKRSGGHIPRVNLLSLNPLDEAYVIDALFLRGLPLCNQAASRGAVSCIVMDNLEYRRGESVKLSLINHRQRGELGISGQVQGRCSPCSYNVSIWRRAVTYKRPLK